MIVILLLYFSLKLFVWRSFRLLSSDLSSYSVTVYNTKAHIFTPSSGILLNATMFPHKTKHSTPPLSLLSGELKRNMYVISIEANVFMRNYVNSRSEITPLINDYKVNTFWLEYSDCFNMC